MAAIPDPYTGQMARGFQALINQLFGAGGRRSVAPLQDQLIRQSRAGREYVTTVAAPAADAGGQLVFPGELRDPRGRFGPRPIAVNPLTRRWEPTNVAPPAPSPAAITLAEQAARASGAAVPVPPRVTPVAPGQLRLFDPDLVEMMARQPRVGQVLPGGGALTRYDPAFAQGTNRFLTDLLLADVLRRGPTAPRGPTGWMPTTIGRWRAGARPPGPGGPSGPTGLVGGAGPAGGPSWWRRPVAAAGGLRGFIGGTAAALGYSSLVDPLVQQALAESVRDDNELAQAVSGASSMQPLALGLATIGTSIGGPLGGLIGWGIPTAIGAITGALRGSGPSYEDVYDTIDEMRLGPAAQTARGLFRAYEAMDIPPEEALAELRGMLPELLAQRDLMRAERRRGRTLLKFQSMVQPILNEVSQQMRAGAGANRLAMERWINALPPDLEPAARLHADQTLGIQSALADAYRMQTTGLLAQQLIESQIAGGLPVNVPAQDVTDLMQVVSQFTPTG